MNTIDKEKFIIYIFDLKDNEQVAKMKDFIQHGNVSTYMHCLMVAYYSYKLAKILKLKLDYRSLVRGAFLHDFFLYDWHKQDTKHSWHGFNHPKIASKNASKYFSITLKEKEIIESHMWPLTFTKMPKSREAFIVSMVDKYLAIRETFFKMENLKEKIDELYKIV